jgi:hypothetical protein
LEPGLIHERDEKKVKETTQCEPERKSMILARSEISLLGAWIPLSEWVAVHAEAALRCRSKEWAEIPRNYAARGGKGGRGKIEKIDNREK